MLKRVVRFLFGCKLPCGHGRKRFKLGTHTTCSICSRHYLAVRFVCKEPRRAGAMIFNDEVKHA
ncbi:hypothetical protein LCGC14_2130500 [marine sediment metagenome]|uniref:Uncharacterized protein n=1 Tax=marine sediment metagenome TaxID=412755 RepID=A0A0F9E1J5_9ZZZZ